MITIDNVKGGHEFYLLASKPEGHIVQAVKRTFGL